MEDIGTVLVTGGSGKAGRWVISEFQKQGYDVVNCDVRPSDQVHTWHADLTDLGQTFGILEGKGAVVHLAAIPWPGEHPPEVVFRNNVLSTFNILQAACVLGIRRVVLAGSESSLGFPFAYRPVTPQYLPMDEDHPLLAQDAYGLGKMTGELLADGYARRDPELRIVTLRFSYIIPPEDYPAELELAWSKPEQNSFNLWGYVDRARRGDCVPVGCGERAARAYTALHRRVRHAHARADARPGAPGVPRCRTGQAGV